MGLNITSFGKEKLDYYNYTQVGSKSNQAKLAQFVNSPYNATDPYTSTVESGRHGVDGSVAIIEANNLQNFGNDQTLKANTRLPYNSTFVQYVNSPWNETDPLGGDNTTLRYGVDGSVAIIEANQLEEYGNNQTFIANTRLPYNSTFMQLDFIESPWNATDPLNGALNSSRHGVDGSVSIIEANELEAYGNNQTLKANTRLPYNSTLVQYTESPWNVTDPLLNGALNSSRYGVDGSNAIIEANELEVFGNNKTLVANTRLPYNSTLLQYTESPWNASDPLNGALNSSRYGVDGSVAIIEANELEVFGNNKTLVANTRLPYNSTLLQYTTSPWNTTDPLNGALNSTRYGVDGSHAIIEANELEVFGNNHTLMANTRLPYNSTFLQYTESPYNESDPLNGNSTNSTRYGVDGSAAIIEANELEVFGNNKTLVANTRLPYNSTLLQFTNSPYNETDPINNMTNGTSPRYGVDGSAAMVEANELEVFGNNKTLVANTRLPYNSTLLQLNTDFTEAGILAMMD
jgi:hypothetical protein